MHSNMGVSFRETVPFNPIFLISLKLEFTKTKKWEIFTGFPWGQVAARSCNLRYWQSADFKLGNAEPRFIKWKCTIFWLPIAYSYAMV